MDIIKCLNTGSLLVIYQNKISSMVKYKQYKFETDCFYILPLEDTYINGSMFSGIIDYGFQYSLDGMQFKNFDYNEEILEMSISTFADNYLLYMVFPKAYIDNYKMMENRTYCLLNTNRLYLSDLIYVKEDDNYVYYIGDYSSESRRFYIGYYRDGESMDSNTIYSRLFDVMQYHEYNKVNAIILSGDDYYIMDHIDTSDYDGDKVQIKAIIWINLDLKANDKVYFRVNLYDSDYSVSYLFNSLLVNFNVGGNLGKFVNKYSELFRENINIKNAENLDFTDIILSDSGCSSMFSGCINMIKGPNKLSEQTELRIYQYMFLNCTSMVNIPELPSKLKSQCFYFMFLNCKSITHVPENLLPATTLDSYCYASMFSGCTSLVNAPELPATTLAHYCYQYMFLNCTSLINAPELPATKLAIICYQYMFSGCSSLVNAPELPATTLTNNCYQYMFLNCTSLVNAPELPATTLANYCYQYMFSGCTSLTGNIDLPAATNVTSHTYLYMFRNTNILSFRNRSLSLGYFSCRYMFSGCKSLKTVILHATKFYYNSSNTNSLTTVGTNSNEASTNNNCFYKWLENVSSGGTCYGPLFGNILYRFSSSVPSNWSKTTTIPS